MVHFPVQNSDYTSGALLNSCMRSRASSVARLLSNRFHPTPPAPIATAAAATTLPSILRAANPDDTAWPYRRFKALTSSTSPFRHFGILSSSPPTATSGVMHAPAALRSAPTLQGCTGSSESHGSFMLPARRRLASFDGGLWRRTLHCTATCGHSSGCYVPKLRCTAHLASSPRKSAAIMGIFAGVPGLGSLDSAAEVGSLHHEG